MKTASWVSRLALGWIAMVVAQIAAGMVIRPKVPSAPHALPWIMLSDAVISVTLGLAALRSGWTRARLVIVLFAITAAISVMSTVEGMLFLNKLAIDWENLLLLMLVTYAIAALAWGFLFGSSNSSATGWHFPQRTWPGKIWLFALSSFTYVFVYYLAGFLVFPYVRDFYATQQLPPPSEIIPLQLFVRGPAFVLICLLLLRMFRLSRWTGALAVGAAFACLNGVAPLIIPNPFFPDHVRWAHFCETTPSNFAFGLVVGLLWVGAQAHSASNESAFPRPGASVAKAV